MREILITTECLDFIDHQEIRVSIKFFQLIEVMEEVKVVHANFVKKLIDSDFYELRVKAGNEIRVIIFAIDHSNFHECSKAICLYGFIKKSTKDYNKAIKQAQRLIDNYL